MELWFDVMLCFNMGRDSHSDVGHINVHAGHRFPTLDLKLKRKC